MALGCNCDDFCWRCDRGFDDEECTCLECCPVHQPKSWRSDLSRFSAAALAEFDRSKLPLSGGGEAEEKNLPSDQREQSSSTPAGES